MGYAFNHYMCDSFFGLHICSCFKLMRLKNLELKRTNKS